MCIYIYIHIYRYICIYIYIYLFIFSGGSAESCGDLRRIVFCLQNDKQEVSRRFAETANLRARSSRKSVRILARDITTVFHPTDNVDV